MKSEKKRTNRYWWSQLSHRQKREVKEEHRRQNYPKDCLKLYIKLLTKGNFWTFCLGLHCFAESVQGHDYWIKLAGKNIK